jgi:hypothetical protein
VDLVKFGELAGTEVDEGAEKFSSLVMRLSKDSELRRTIGAKAKKIHDEQFCWKVISRKMMAHL